MQIVVLPRADAGPILRSITGHEPGSPEAVADLLRSEVSARGRCPRHFAIGRVCRLATPAITLDAAQVEDVCDALELNGDVLLADGGLLHPAPVRVVDLGDGSCRFICSIPSRALVSAAPGDWSERGVLRDCRPAKSIAEIARALGGIVLTPAAWAGLDGVPSANAAFL